MAQLEAKIHEVIVTTRSESGRPHSAPMGVEEVNGHRLLVVGTSREPKGEWIRSMTLLGSSG